MEVRSQEPFDGPLSRAALRVLDHLELRKLITINTSFKNHLVSLWQADFAEDCQIHLLAAEPPWYQTLLTSTDTATFSSLNLDRSACAWIADAFAITKANWLTTAVLGTRDSVGGRQLRSWADFLEATNELEWRKRLRQSNRG
jgi:hypothetical protein